jgi:chromosome segregation ATPase
MPTINRTIFGKSTILIDRGINTKTPVMIDTITKTITQKAQPSQPPPQLPLKQKSSSPELKKATYDEELYTIKEQIQQIRQQQSAPIKPTTSSSRTISKVSSTLDHELRDLDNHLQGYSQSSKIITETPATKAKWDKSLQEIENQLQNIEQPFQNKSIIKTTIHNHYSNRISEDKNTLYKNLKWINTKLKSPEQKNTPLQYSLKTITPTISTLSTPTTSLKIEPTNTTSKTKIINSHSSKQKKDYTKELSAIEETLHQIR